MNKKIRQYGIIIGSIPTGKNNSITDVEGVKVGHTTLDDGKIKTGVTAIIPHVGNIFKEKLIAASHVINGFGKSTGLIQIDELGTIETPIIMTNTLSVGTAHEALVRWMIENNDDIGDTTGTVNPIICECNDGTINDIRGLHVEKNHIYEAIKNADIKFQEGNVGAGTGMMCYGLKGGIGSSSRIIELANNTYTVGVLVLSNFGSLEDFVLNGDHIGKRIFNDIEGTKRMEDKGSIIFIVATDIPLSSRQLKRIIKRTYPGISRTGSYTGNGSGEVVIGFSTANKINHYEEQDRINIDIINENKMNDIFKGVVEATEEAILNSLVCSNGTVDRKGNKVHSLKEFI
ncbi:DmpA family aminopeptidase [Tissierella creatinophila]|uniref:Peptidase family S58 n=1 Tax=Tissierella creatinophila DSM 6911 TaxID=1123403 RepID=A0A1U7M6Y3_TISCR|nr:P1 family peptidase [Tissierella creatinophila]OLS03083.1 peptidase family S58 [Tissierella creatinophila DSM 6911]